MSFVDRARTPFLNRSSQKLAHGRDGSETEGPQERIAARYGWCKARPLVKPSRARVGINTSSGSKTTLWVGRIVSAFAVLFLIFDGVIKVLQLAPAVEATAQLGYPENLVLALGIVELACLVIYVIPRSSILGAILLTGYLGGAIASHVRIGSALFSVVFPIIIGALLWGGLFLRHSTLRTLIPLRS